MASLILVIIVSLIGVFPMVYCRFVLYDSDDSKTKVDIGAEFADIKKILVNISSNVEAKADGSNTPLEMMCLDGWFRFKESCYFFDSKNLDFQTAEKECNKWEAHLLRLETQEENHFIKAFMASHFKKDTHNWIGMTDTEKEGVWKISGTDKVVPFTDWGVGEPSNSRGNEDCGMFWHDFSYRWNDSSCDYKYRAICEKSSRSLTKV